MSKRDRLQKVAELLLEIYPHLDGAMIEGDVENPESITFMGQNVMKEKAEKIGIEVEELIDDEQELLEYFGFDDDDDDGGYLQ